MMRSLYAGVSGLKTHQIKMDVIGNNIANVNTVAYKSSSITFSELMYQTTQKASGANATTGTAGVNAKQIGLGVKSGAISTSITSAGATQTTGNPFDIKITGNSFFVVSDGNNNFFTRDGSFYVDGLGNLAMSSNGFNVMGWGVDEATQTIKQDTVSALRVMSEENMTYPPAATTQGYISGILDKNDTNVSTEAGKVVNLSFYDNLGYSYTAKMSVHETTTPGQYYMQLDDVLNSKGESLSDTYGVPLTDIVNMGSTSTVGVSDSFGPAPSTSATGSTSVVYNSATGYTISYFDAAGNPDTTTYPSGTQTLALATVQALVTPSGAIATNLGDLQEIFGNSLSAQDLEGTIDPATGTLTVTSKQIYGGILQYNTDNGGFTSINGDTKGITMNFQDSYTDGAGAVKSLLNFGDIFVNMTTSTLYNNNGTSTIGATSGDLNGLGAGRKLGELSGISIQNNGMIYASYDNGQSRLLGQIAVAEFSNASGLAKEGDNLYSATLNSGDFDGIGTDISGNGGYMSTGVLEMSNVDLSSEFTEMITTQRGFQANSRIITTSDSLLEELVNLKR